ncbi:MAG: hypothetical protein Q9213_005558, partial [Squamulea squamosa]
MTPTSPPIEPNSSPQLPPHFSMVEVFTSNDFTDIDCVVFSQIEAEIDQILSSVQPPFHSAFSNYGTISRYYDDEGYDPVLHPKLIVIEIDPQSVRRWAEVDPQIRSLVRRAY